MTPLSGSAADLYRQYFERTGDAFLIIEGDMFVACNQATVEMLRYRSRDELLQTHPSELSPEFQPDGRRSFEKANEMMAIATEKGSHRFEWDHQRADGEVFPVEVLLTAVPIEGGRMLHVVWRDLTGRRRLEAELLQANKLQALGRLSSGIAHDFNNLLVAVIGHAELLVADLGDLPEQQASAAEILKAGRRAADLVGQLLAYSRKQVLRPRQMDLAAALDDLAGMLRRLVGEDVTTEVEIGERPLWVSADPGQISQVILNLAANARDAMHKGGLFRISVARVQVEEGLPGLSDPLAPGAYAALMAEDDGSGIAPGDVPHIFDPFFTTKPTGRGTGLGLATVYGIVRQSGGSIAVRSTPPEGTRFVVYLPLAAAPDPALVTAAATGSERETAPARTTVLLVDDEVATGRLVSVMLERAGYRVHVVSGGADALHLLADPEITVDVLLTDLVMPGMDGAELVRRAREIRGRLPVIVTSGYPAEYLDDHGGVPADADLLQKPFSSTELERRIAAVLGRRD